MTTLPLTPDTILDAVAAVFPATRDAITGPRRRRNECDARHCAAYILYKYLRYSNRQVGEILGGRDHTTVAISRQAFLNVYQTDRQYRYMANRVLDRLGLIPLT